MVVLPCIDSSPLCPVKAIVSLFNRFPLPQDSPAFAVICLGKVVPLSYGQFISMLRSFLTRLGLQPNKYAGHSLRRGGATWAFSTGVTPELIKLQGDWKSNVYQLYLELPVSCRIAVGQAMAAGLKNVNNT